MLAAVIPCGPLARMLGDRCWEGAMGMLRLQIGYLVCGECHLSVVPVPDGRDAMVCARCGTQFECSAIDAAEYHRLRLKGSMMIACEEEIAKKFDPGVKTHEDVKKFDSGVKTPAELDAERRAREPGGKV